MGRRLPLGRPNKKRVRSKRHLILLNGRVTEREYFERLIDALGLRGSVAIDTREAGKDPLSLVRSASKRKREEELASRREGFDSWSSVWAVSDVDDFRPQGAQNEATKNGIELILSNPCFEVWLIDHVTVCPESCAATALCSRKARELGVVQSTDHKRASRSKMKAVSVDVSKQSLSNAVVCAQKHNSAEKRKAREGDADRVESYTVWTDMPKIVGSLIELGGVA